MSMRRFLILDTLRSGRSTRTTRSALTLLLVVKRLTMLAMTMMKSSTFHGVRRYAWLCATKPSAITLSTHSTRKITVKTYSEIVRNVFSPSGLSTAGWSMASVIEFATMHARMNWWKNQFWTTVRQKIRSGFSPLKMNSDDGISSAVYSMRSSSSPPWPPPSSPPWELVVSATWSAKRSTFGASSGSNGCRGDGSACGDRVPPSSEETAAMPPGVSSANA
mmetsp:Transcript_19244/g.59797  ORF Transcript_19244/g.59797 Transcript_19244/m.59797 type:complete len:220 (-) Transcript_19244:743-1402(-)